MIVAFVSNAFGTAKRLDNVQQIPFTLYRNHLVVAVGSLGGLEQKHLLLDTGANVSVVDTATAHELGLDKSAHQAGDLRVIDGVAQIYFSSLPTMDLGPIHRTSMPVAVSNLSWLHDQAGVQVDAVIGLDALSPINFEIDYQLRTVRFGAIRACKSAVPVVKADGLLTIHAQINGEPVSLMVDTGGSSLILFANTLTTTGSSRSQTSKVESLAGEEQLQRLSLKKFSIGRTSLDGSTALIASGRPSGKVQGILGISAAQFKSVEFDFSRGTVGFELQDRGFVEPFAMMTHGVSESTNIRAKRDK